MVELRMARGTQGHAFGRNIYKGRNVNLHEKIFVPAKGVFVEHAAVPKQITVSAKKSTFYNDFAWVKDIPDDAILEGERAQVVTKKAAQIFDALKELVPTINDVRGPVKLSDIPESLVEDLKNLRDASKEKTVKNVMASLVGIYSYLGIRVLGAASVAGMPTLDPFSKALSLVVATMLLAGEGVVRIPTSISYQYSNLKALERGPEYYKTTLLEKQKASGMLFDPTNLKRPFKIFRDYLRCVQVLYLRNEKNVFQRSLWGHLLVDNLNRRVLAVGAPDTKELETTYRKDIDAVISWAEGIRALVNDAKKPGMTSANARNICDNLIKVLDEIAKRHDKKGLELRDKAIESFGNNEQGEPSKLDFSLAMQFFAHAKKWREALTALKDVKGQYDSGKVSGEQMIEYLKGYFDYLNIKFKFDIVFNQRIPKTVDREACGIMTGRISDVLTNAGVGLDDAVDHASFMALINAMEKEYAKVRPIRALIVKLLSAIKGKDFNARYAQYELNATQKMRTVRQVLEELVTEEFSRHQYRGGAKAGQRSYLINKMGHAYALYENDLGTRFIVEKSEWSGMSAKLMEGNEIFVKAFDSLTKGVNGAACLKDIDADKREKIIDEIKQTIKCKNPLDVQERTRSIERLEGNYIEDSGSLEDFTREALTVALYDKYIEWMVFPEADVIGSFDKDYVPMSIDLYTGQYMDIFRNDVPMLKKWSRDHNNQRIAIIQNPQDQEYFMSEGPLKEVKDGHGRVTGYERMSTPNGRRLDPVSRCSVADQQPWYGEAVLAALLEGFIKKACMRRITVRQFLAELTSRVYKNDPNSAQVMLDIISKDVEQARGYEKANKLPKLGAELDETLDMTTAKELLERLKRHTADEDGSGICKFGKDIMIATGIGPGRTYFGSFFSCGTCELEYIPGMHLGYDRPYITDVKGEMLAQTEIRYNRRTGRMEIYDYIPRFSKFTDSYGEEGTERNILKDGMGAIASDEMQVRETHKYSKEEISAIERENPGKIVQEAENNRIKVRDGVTKEVEKVIWSYRHGKDLRKVVCEYAEDTGEKIYRDYDPDGKNYYETRLARNRAHTETIACKDDEKAIVSALSNLCMTREIEGEPEILRDPDEYGEGDVRIRIRTVLPMISTKYVVVDEKGLEKYSERTGTYSSFQPDKWVTEDMATTYFHYLTGWQTEVHIAKVGSAVGPSDFVDLFVQMRRWFKGGPEVFLDFLKYLKAYPELRDSVQGYFLKQSYLWPAHAITDNILAPVPAAVWAGQYMAAAMALLKIGVAIGADQAIVPLVTPTLYVPLFIFYLWQTIGVYRRTMEQMGNGWGEIWRKESLYATLGPAYVSAFFEAVNRISIPFETTAAGDRKQLPYKFLKAIEWRKDLHQGTAMFGVIFSAAVMAMLKDDTPLTLAFLSYNWMFPALKYAQLSYGIKNYYGYWTKFNMHIAEQMEMERASETVVSNKKIVEFTLPNAEAAGKAVRVLKAETNVVSEHREEKENGVRVVLELGYAKPYAKKGQVPEENEKEAAKRIRAALEKSEAAKISIQEPAEPSVIVSFRPRNDKEMKAVQKRIEGTQGIRDGIRHVAAEYPVTTKIVAGAAKGIGTVISGGAKYVIGMPLKYVVYRPLRSLTRGFFKSLSFVMNYTLQGVLRPIAGAIRICRKAGEKYPAAAGAVHKAARFVKEKASGTFAGVCAATIAVPSAILFGFPVEIKSWKFKKALGILPACKSILNTFPVIADAAPYVGEALKWSVDWPVALANAGGRFLKRIWGGSDKVGKIAGSVREGDKLIMEIKPDGKYKSVDERAWTDGNFYFAHDKLTQKYEYKQVKKISRKSQLKAFAEGGQVRRIRQAIRAYDELAAKKQSRAVTVEGIRAKDDDLVKAGKEALTKGDATLKNLRDIIIATKNRGRRKEALEQMIQLLLRGGNNQEAAVIMLGMIAGGTGSVSLDEKKYMKKAEFDSILRDVYFDRGELTVSLIEALKGKIVDGRIIFDVLDAKGLQTQEKKAVIEGIGAKKLAGIAGPMVPSQEKALFAGIEKIGLKGIVDETIKELYGLGRKTYDDLVANSKNGTRNPEAVRSIISEAVGTERDITKAEARKNKILIRVVGLENLLRVSKEKN